MAMQLKFRLNCIDHYQAPASSLDPILSPLRSSNQEQPRDATIPIIRIFGSTESGQKICAHVHGAFPYLYIAYDGDLEASAVDSYIRTLATSIDHAFALSYRRNAFEGPVTSYVAHISLVKGVPFYGYHVGYRHFLKIYLRNPNHMTRFADLLLQGAILAKPLQPFESHLQYLLQWMCDYNVYGCGYIICDKFAFRTPVPPFDESIEAGNTWNEQSIDPSLILDGTEFQRQSYCDLEVDVQVEAIVNRHELQPRDIHKDFDERFFKPDGLKFVHSMANLWRDEARRRRIQMGQVDSKDSPFPSEALVSMSADPNLVKGGWVHENEFFNFIKRTIAKEHPLIPANKLGFDSFLAPPKPESDLIQTAYQSVGDFFASNAAKLVSSLDNSDKTTQITPVVDESSIFELDKLLDHGNGPAPEKRMREPSSSNGSREGQFSPVGSGRGKGVTKSPMGSPSKRIKLQNENPKSSAGSVGNRQSSRLSKRFIIPDSDSLRGQDSQVVLKTSDESDYKVSSQSGTSSQGTQKQITSNFPLAKSSSNVGIHKSGEFSTPNHSKDPMDSLPESGKDDTNLHMYSTVAPERVSISSKRITKISSGMQKRFGTKGVMNNFLFKYCPPDPAKTMEVLKKLGAPTVISKEAFYSDENDVPDKPREYAGKEFRIQSVSVPFLPKFDPTGRGAGSLGEGDLVVVDKNRQNAKYKDTRQHCSLRSWQIGKPPPSPQAVHAWLQRHSTHRIKNNGYRRSVPYRSTAQQGSSQVKSQAPSLARDRIAKAMIEEQTQYMSMMSLEIHVNTRGNLAPDPMEDPIIGVFWSIQGESISRSGGFNSGVILAEDNASLKDRFQSHSSTQLDYMETELDLLNRTVDIVRNADPDILVGYEVHNGSWGFLIERARLKYEYDLPSELSRVKSNARGRFTKDDRWGFTQTSSITITGRHMFNVWRAIRSELNLLQYTLENVSFRVLKRRIPHYDYSTLTKWFKSGNVRFIAKVVNYYALRAKLDLQILEAIDIVARTSEQARILGVDFFSVISRGSQFKVESLMFRIAKPESYLLISPSKRQVGGQNALECLPLVMEPQSSFYPSPLLVLDFQSLYPSIMIAYNYCYSTCLGRVASWRGGNKLGVTDYKREPGILELLKDHINVSPNGMIYVRPEIRKGILGRMLTEILETRVMVKSGMKQDKHDIFLQRLLNNRQLALKLIANVTYGYTSASFSGRMPCSEIADSIVQTARETLERSIAMIHAKKEWGAEVVYGDTDSLFVYLKGRSRNEAFEIGKDIANTITKANPRPVKLKFEKVYHPCVLLAKKRYVGFKYESPDQKVPEFDAKGIETVRRDGTPAEQKIEEKALKLLFRTHDLSQVKKYFQSECEKIINGNVNIQDFLFAREVRLGTYSDNGIPPAGALIATKRMHFDARREPQYGERVPFLVMAGAPGARLIDRCVDPGVLLNDAQAELDAEYYITKNLIPPLERIFNLAGANVRAWYDEIPKAQRLRTVANMPNEVISAINRGEYGAQVDKTLENYLHENNCLVCHGEIRHEDDEEEETRLVCSECSEDTPSAIFTIASELQAAEKRQRAINDVCRSCSGAAFSDEIMCDSRDCPVFYTRVRHKSRLDALMAKVRLLTEG